ncbi:slit homolog 1 protein-like [Mercenaria mercenaria]|uniref:slit homolog 1 protein-like n=1 Tax=Mercenaria mercenaria TaxID=6596 RepID=UPI001E1D7808|nr:slit homolog 1 protein-like [Mercenaria mercenaria]
MEYMTGKLGELMLLAIVLLALHVKAEETEDSGVCPRGCSCPETELVECQNLSQIPNFTNKEFLKSLSFNDHNITELKKGDFNDFTHLEQLYVNGGMLSTIAAGTFEAVSETIQLINLRSNIIAELEPYVFFNLSNIDKIVLNANHLISLKANSFVNMSKLTTLDILGNNLQSVDKEAFIGLPELENLNLFNNHLKQIPFESLTGLTALKVMTLTRNEITTVPELAKAFLPALEDIYLDSNPISEIAVFPNISGSLKRIELEFTDISTTTKETWKYLSQIDQLNIGGTKFSVITAGTFEGLPNLKRLMLRDMPHLTFVGPDAFHGIKDLTTIDLADCKQLHTIDETAFMSTKVTSFFLKGSGVTYIPRHLLKWSTMKTVSIEGNPINCDCKVDWMLDKAIFGNNTGVKNSFNKLVCATPKVHFGKNVTSLHSINLTCKSYEDDHASRFATGIIIAVICFVFMTTIALIMKFRQKIMISCRRYYQYRRYKNDLVFTVEHDTSIAELEDTDGPEGRPLKDMRLETVSIET